MFSFFKRSPEITIDCFTAFRMIYETTPIVHAYKATPEWWDNIKKPEGKLYRIHRNGAFNNANVKTCAGFLELYKRGIILENWSDRIIKIENNKMNTWAGFDVGCDIHPRELYGEGFKNYFHLKMISPWFFKEKTGVKFVWLGAEWSLEDFYFRVLPGVVDFKLNASTHVNMMIPNYDTEFVIPLGLPLAQIIPLTDKKIKLKQHLVSEIEYKKMSFHSQNSFYGWRKFVQIDKRNQKRESKCPFS
jgi:hypothetical protein